jgi:hypothetical protein
MKITIENATRDQKRAYITELLEEANSHFVTVEFTKKNGEERSMNIQQAALKFHVKGDEASESAKKAVETRKANHPELMAVYDVQKHEIRSINLDTTSIVRLGGKEYVFAE